MRKATVSLESGTLSANHIAALLRAHQQEIFIRTDRLFLWVMPLQWLLTLACALWISPQTWVGMQSRIHPHVWAAFLIGSLLTVLPVWFAWSCPGRAITRQTIAVAQMLMSALLIHINGGRIEAHFHVFGSLAFLAFYRDRRVLLTATAIVAMDHFARGIFWPQSVYGVLSAAPWRTAEHVGWVSFEDIFLFLSIRQSIREMEKIAERQAALESTNASIERTVAERTHELTCQIAERRESERRFTDMLRNVDLISLMLDREARITYCNDHLLQLTGWQSDEVLGQCWFERFTPPECHDLKDVFAALLDDSPTAWHHENEIVTRSGARRLIRWSNSVLRSPSGNVIGATSIGEDITVRRMAEEALRRSEERFRQLAENIREVFWMTSPDSRELIYVSPAYEEIWGRTCASAYERPESWMEAVLPEDRATMLGGMERKRQGESAAVEFRIARPNGDVRWISSRGFPIFDAGGQLQRIVGLAADITERKRLELKMLEAGKLETVGRLAGGIAHDFNTILTAIIGHAELIGQAVPPGGPEFLSADQIGKSAARAAQLTQQLLAFSRKQLLQPRILDLNATVAETELMLRRLLGGSIDVRVAINARHPWARADGGQIQQMLVQLALNAQDAMPRGGRLTLETGEITLDETYAETREDIVAGEYVMIAITDTGNGIADEVKPRLFEPFFTTKPQGEGTGLGLSMCYGIAKQLGGHISVYSEQGRGTTFKVFLPRAAAAASVPVALPPQTDFPPTRGTETILLVEDDAALRDLAGIVLEKLGYHVHQAANGREAIEIAEQLPTVDLLLTDVVMPQMSGQELAMQLNQSRPRMKVLFTSAYTEEAIVHHGILKPGIDFLHKPYTPGALARKTREALDGYVEGSV